MGYIKVNKGLFSKISKKHDNLIKEILSNY